MNAPRGKTANVGGKTGDEVREMFAAIAPRYDRANSILSFGCDAHWRRRAAAEAAGIPPGPIVDICAGTGKLACELARSGRRVVAMDFCEPMLRIGRAGARAGGPAVAFACADALRLPLADGAASLVSVAFGLRNVADVDGCLREMVRVAARGGKVVILEFSAPRGRIFGALYSLYFRAILPRAGRMISGVPTDAYGYLPRSVGAFPGPEELAARMRAAGLSDVSARPLTRGIVHLYVGQKG